MNNILDGRQPDQRKIIYWRILYIWIVIWMLVNVLLGLEYYVAASGMLITTPCPPDVVCPPPHTPFMDDCWKYLLLTNAIGILGLWILIKKIKSISFIE